MTEEQAQLDGAGDALSIDLHGCYPDAVEAIVPDAVEQAWTRGARTLRVIHGHGHDRRPYVLFTRSNTGPLGMAVRRLLREDKTLRQWMYAKVDCSEWSWTTVRLRPKGGDDGEAG